MTSTPQPTNPEPEHQESQDESCKSPESETHSWKFDGDDPYIECHFCGEVRDALNGRVITPGRGATPPPQPAKPKCITCGREGHGACGGLGPVKATPSPTKPIESDHVKAWMLANGWKRYSNDPDDHVWIKNDYPAIDQTLAAEMYRMSEVGVKEARIDENESMKEALSGYSKNDFCSNHEKYVSACHACRKSKLGNYFCAEWYKIVDERLKQLAATNPRKEA